MTTVKFADKIRAVGGDGLTSLSPMAAAAKSEFHEALLKRVVASARLLRIDLPLDKPVNVYELNSKLSASSNLSERMVLKDLLWRLGCIHE